MFLVKVISEKPLEIAKQSGCKIVEVQYLYLAALNIPSE